MDEAQLMEIVRMLRSVAADKLTWAILLIIFSRSEASIQIKDLSTAMAKVRSSITIQDAVTLADRAAPVVNEIYGLGLSSPIGGGNMEVGGKMADKIREAFSPNRNISNVDDASLFGNVGDTADILLRLEPAQVVPFHSTGRIGGLTTIDLPGAIGNAGSVQPKVRAAAEQVYNLSNVQGNKVFYAMLNYNTGAQRREMIPFAPVAAGTSYIIKGTLRKVQVDVLNAGAVETVVSEDIIVTFGNQDIVVNSVEPRPFEWGVPAQDDQKDVGTLKFKHTLGAGTGIQPAVAGFMLTIDEVSWDGGGRVVFNSGKLLSPDTRLGDLHGAITDPAGIFDEPRMRLLRMNRLYTEYLKRNWGVGIAELVKAAFIRQHPTASNNTAWKVEETARGLPGEEFFFNPRSYFLPSGSVHYSSTGAIAHTEFLRLWTPSMQRTCYQVWYCAMLDFADLMGGDGQFIEWLEQYERNSVEC
jgi:hypothetical protein